MFTFAKFCRICLDDDGQLINMLILDDDNISYFNKLQFCFPNLQFKDAPSLLHICNDCSQNLKMVYDFHSLFLGTESMLKGYTEQLVQLEPSESYKLCDLVVELPKVKILPNEEFTMFEHIKLEPEDNIKVEYEYIDYDEEIVCKEERPADIEVENNALIKKEEANDEKLNSDSEENNDNDYIETEDEDYKEKPSRKRRKHRRHIKYKCEKCVEYFYTKLHLNIHLRKCRNKTPVMMLYQCDHCDKQFKKISSLNSHKKELHEAEEKPHACKVCSKRFVDINLLCSHGRCHTGEVPHKCVVCGTLFDDPCKLRLHGRTHIDTDINEDEEYWDPVLENLSMPSIKQLLKQT